MSQRDGWGVLVMCMHERWMQGGLVKGGASHWAEIYFYLECWRKTPSVLLLIFITLKAPYCASRVAGDVTSMHQPFLLYVLWPKTIPLSKHKIGESQMHVFLLTILLKCVWDRFWSHTQVRKTYIICKLISLPCNSITYFSLVQTSLKDSPS